MGIKQTKLRGFGRPMIFVFVAVLLVATTGLVRAVLLDDPDLIEPPIVIAGDDSATTNNRQQAFNEKQSISLDQATIDRFVRCTYGQVVAGDVVNSHTIFYNSPFRTPEVDANRLWQFEGEIICIMAERSGRYQGITDSLFGIPGVEYPGPFEGRGLERDGDSVSFTGGELTLTMTDDDGEPGDWIRVLTRTPIPEDDVPPGVLCEPRSNPANAKPDKGQGTPGGPYVMLVGSDDKDGPVDLYLTDNQSGVEFGPFTDGTTVQVSKAQANPRQLQGNGNVDFRLRVQGSTTISAKDSAGNVGTETCTE